MQNNNLTHDFMTDHPWATLAIGLGAMSLINNVGAKDRYEIAQLEARKQAFKKSYMRENPFRLSDYIDDQDLMCLFCEYAFGLSWDEVKKSNYNDLIDCWNGLHGGFIKGKKLPKSDDEAIQEKSWNFMYSDYRSSSQFKSVVKAASQKYVDEIDEVLLIDGII